MPLPAIPLTRGQKVLLVAALVELIHYAVLALRGDPLNVGNLLSLALAGICMAWLLASRKGLSLSRLSPGIRRSLAIATIFCATLWLGTLSWIVAGARAEEERPVDAMLVLGAGLKNGRATHTLERRIEAASVWLLQHRQTRVIACGGVTLGQTLSEAEAIRDGLVRRGVEIDRILLEDRSTSTEENLRFARAVLEAQGAGPHPRVLITTSNYHLARARLLAAREGFEAYGLPASTPWYSLPNQVARETLAVLKTAIMDRRPRS